MKQFRMKILVVILLSFFAFQCKKHDNPVSPGSSSPVLTGYVTDSAGNPLESVGIHYLFTTVTFHLFKQQHICPSTVIYYTIPKPSRVVISIYRWYTRDSLQGIVHDSLNAGTYSDVLDVSKLTSGMYIYRITTNWVSYENVFVLGYSEVNYLLQTTPLTRTDMTGRFSLPYGIFGINYPIRYFSEVGSITDSSFIISSSIKLVLYKQGYQPLVYPLTIDTTRGMQLNLKLEK